jgi:hypothetical protein
MAAALSSESSSRARDLAPCRASVERGGHAVRLWRGAALAGVVSALVWSCAKAQPTPTCDPGQSLCAGPICTDVQKDPDNCGACGTSCPLAQVCVAGKCATDCPPSDEICTPDGGTRGYCVDVKNDNENCGKCGETCPNGQTCVNGTCSSSCAKTSTLCQPDGGGAAYCVDLQTDNENCGACGTACPQGEVCAAGKCAGACTTSQTKCTPDAGPAYCTDTKTDNANCGACGNACGVLEACIDGQCTSACTALQTLCTPDGGQPFCADTKSDNTNCGSCGNACPSNKPVCIGGVCATGNCNMNALVLGDGDTNSNSAYQTLLQNAGFTVTLQSSGTTTYSGTPAASGFGVVIVTPGQTYSSDMPAGGQTSIANAVAGSALTGVIFTEWAAYEVLYSKYTTLAPLLCFTRSSGTTSTLTFSLVQTGHPIWNGLATSFTTSVTLGANISGTLNSGATEIASCTQCGTYGVAVRDPSSTGRVVQIAHAAAYSGYAWYSDSNLTKMMANSALWAARCD